MTDRPIAVFGGSGFIGREIVRRLAAQGTEVRVAVRRPERVADEDYGAGKIVAIGADVWRPETIEPAVAGCGTVVNTVGHYVAQGAKTFEAIHGKGAGDVARYSSQAGVQQLVHISGLGTDADSESPYVRARASGESQVRSAFPGATILRPSVVFGPGDAFFNRLASVAAPLVPLFGRGETRLQPVYVGDVAEAVARALETPAVAGQVVELGGPRVYPYKTLVQMVLDQLGRRGAVIPVPFAVWRVLAQLLSVLPNPPLSPDQVTLMKQDNVVGDGALTFAALGIEPKSVEDILPTYVGRRPS
jgi:NADH dehydrogenase